MAWIEIHQSLITHRKTMILADVLDTEEIYIVGHLTGLWTWALDNAPDGILPDSARLIARAAHWKGDAQKFLDALKKSGFVDSCEELGSSILHDWEDYAGRLIEKRKANTQRMRDARTKKNASVGTENEPTANDSDDENERIEGVQRTCGTRAGATVPNPTQPYTPPPPREESLLKLQPYPETDAEMEVLRVCGVVPSNPATEDVAAWPNARSELHAFNGTTDMVLGFEQAWYRAASARGHPRQNVYLSQFAKHFRRYVNSNRPEIQEIKDHAKMESTQPNRESRAQREQRLRADADAQERELERRVADELSLPQDFEADGNGFSAAQRNPAGKNLRNGRIVESPMLQLRS